MRWMLRAVVATVLLVAAAFTVTACGSSDDSSESASTTTGGGRGGAKITVWHNSADPPALRQLYKDFEADTGNEVELVAIPSAGFEDTTLTKWASGARPDVLEYHPTVTNLLALNPRNTLRDLSGEEYIAKSGDLYRSAATVDGTTYGAIIGFPQVFGMFYNKDVFARAGIATPPGNAQELAQACTDIKARAPGVTPIAESGGSVWPPQVLPSLLMGDANQDNAWGQELRSNRAALDDDGSPFVRAMETYRQLKDDGCFNRDLVTATVENSVRALVEGRAAMVALHSDMIPAIVAAAGGDAARVDRAIGFLVLGGESAAATYIPGPIGSYYLPRTGDGDREAAALDFVRYATGRGYGRYIEASRTFPIIEGTPEPSGISALQREVKAAYDRGPANIAYAADVPGVAGVAALINKLMIDETTPQEMAEQTQKQIEQAAKAAKLEGW
ncbi:ABC transporter substrate-binding protein [Conexibacter woesei]|uniref:Extracellular solute-binding protein family 1 n=1 Tax=Conexibacter woesei (strain DSM 14684 / CCUG 47730 / CIP 108061 / JCM 11494 / NBRC 100937 / ID131577) TaxID=469383 RepID=D3F600_CONWI|nr:extracellular solute-binding protein [Conexibacter woesei]ADB48673.1 extracellular solute-binding protein family 1 [Conexibacter woesei DSM 14684]